MLLRIMIPSKMALSTMTHGSVALSIIKLGKMTLSITTLDLMSLSITTDSKTLCLMTLRKIYFIAISNRIKSSVMLSVIRLNVVMLKVITLLSLFPWCLIPGWL
jgi:hypothetical protein